MGPTDTRLDPAAPAAAPEAEQQLLSAALALLEINATLDAAAIAAGLDPRRGTAGASADPRP